MTNRLGANLLSNTLVNLKSSVLSLGRITAIGVLSEPRDQFAEPSSHNRLSSTTPIFYFSPYTQQHHFTHASQCPAAHYKQIVSFKPLCLQIDEQRLLDG